MAKTLRINNLCDKSNKAIDKMRADMLLKDGTDLTKEGAVIVILKQWYDDQMKDEKLFTLTLDHKGVYQHSKNSRL